jgi:hypothetical protein
LTTLTTAASFDPRIHADSNSSTDYTDYTDSRSAESVRFPAGGRNSTIGVIAGSVRDAPERMCVKQLSSTR